jgi:uncharacterized protein YjdB
MNCYSLKNCSLPKTLTAIGSGAFHSDSGLTSIVLYENVSSVGDEAFAGCGTMDVIIPGQTIPAFGTDVFAGTTPTVYCYSYSDADFWAAEKKYTIIHLNATGLPLSLTLPEDTTLNVGATLTIAPSIYPADPDAVFSWSSSDSGVVSVENGVLTALAPGKATITASCGSCSDSMVITSYIRLTDFELEDQVMVAKEILQLTPKNLQPAGAEPAFSWSSADTTIVSMSVNGYATGVKPGVTQVTATAHGISRTCTIRVCYPVSAVSFTQSAYALYVDDRQQLTANVTTRDGTFVNELITFTTSDPKVATVSEKGLVTVHAPGSATITAAASSGVSATLTITASDYLTLALPAQLTAISAESLMNTGAEAVRIPAGCTAIDEKAFANSSRLLAVYMPDSITTIAANAFDGCTSVKFICDSDNAAARYAREHGIPCIIR